MKRLNRCKRLEKCSAAPILVLFSILALLVYLPGAAHAFDASEYEYEADEGLHEEEWYDPSDWFDTPGEGISYESDWYDSTYGYTDDYYDDNLYGYYGNGYYDYGNDFYDAPYGAGYDYDYNYYTNDWYRDGGVFDVW